MNCINNFISQLFTRKQRQKMLVFLLGLKKVFLDL